MKSRGAVSSSQRKGEFGVEEVEAGVAALSDKVARLREDIGALKRANGGSAGSHRETRMQPTNMTYAGYVDDRPREKKAARFAKGTRGGDEDGREGEARASRSRSHGLAADPREAAASSPCLVPARTTATTTATTRQRKRALIDAQRKNRAQPQQAKRRADDDDDAQRNARHPHASDVAPTPEGQRPSTRKVVRKRISRGIQYDTRDCQVANCRVSIKCSRVKSPEMRGNSRRHRPDLHEPAPAGERLDRAARAAPADGKLVKGREDAAASQKDSDSAGERAKKTVLSADGEEGERTQDAPKAQPSPRQKQAGDPGNGSGRIKSRKVGEKDQDSKARTAANAEIASKIKKLSKATAKKIEPDKKKFHSISKKAPDDSQRKSGNKDSMKSSRSTSHENESHKSQQQNTKKKSKSIGPIQTKRLVMRDKVSNCTRELNQLLRKVSGLFRKKSSKSKRVTRAL